jgi:flagella basal body P-ring formation protein FlgA
VHVDERAALQQWIDEHNPDAAKDQDDSATQHASADAPGEAISASAKQSAAPAVAQAAPAIRTTEPVPTLELDPKPLHSLRDLLSADLSTHLNLPAESLQISFNPADDAVLNLVEPYFRFNITPRRVHNLGEVSWDVTIVTGAATKNMTVTAMAKAWQTQAVLNKPVAFKQVIREDDLTEHRTLVDALSSETPITRAQAVGQQAARDLKPGTMLTGRMVDPLPLVRAGELVTVTLTQGSVQIKTVARALEGGTYGQTIRVRNETTKDVFEVTMVAQQEARLGTPTTPSVAANN